MSNSMGENAALKGRWDFVARRVDGSIKWTASIENKIVNEQLDNILDWTWRNQTQDTAWYCGLTGNSPTPAAGDTMSTHDGWTEFTDYDEAARVTWSPGAASSQSITNSSPMVYTSSSDANSVGGAFISSNSTKGGSTGTLSNVGAFTQGNKALDTGETVSVTVTISAASST